MELAPCEHQKAGEQTGMSEASAPGHLLSLANMCADPPEDIRAGSTGQFHQTQGRLEHDSQLLPDILPPNSGNGL